MLTANPTSHRRSVSTSSGAFVRGHSRIGSFFDKSQRYSFVYAQQKVDYLAQFGYVLMGQLPSYKDIPSMQRSPLSRYLFLRNGKYYQFKGNDFLDAEFTVMLDGADELLQTMSFSKIVEGDFIHLMIRERYPLGKKTSERLVMLLKPDDSLSGHPMLAGSYGRKCGFLLMAKSP